MTRCQYVDTRRLSCPSIGVVMPPLINRGKIWAARISENGSYSFKRPFGISPVPFRKYLSRCVVVLLEDGSGQTNETGCTDEARHRITGWPVCRKGLTI